MVKLCKLGEIFKITSGGTPSRKKSEYFLRGDIPWVKTGDLKNKYVEFANEMLTKQGLANSSAKLFPRDTVLIAMYGATIGATSIMKISAATNQACAAFLPSKEVLPVYLYYFLLSSKRSFVSKGVGGAQPNISATILKSIKIPLPPLPIQQKIARVLDQADALRQRHRQIIHHYDQLAQSVFLDMFGDPVKNPKEWEIEKLGCFGNWRSGGTPSRKNSEYFKGNIPWLSSGELESMFLSSSNEHITEAAIKNSAASIVEPPYSLMLGMYDTAALKSTINTIACTCNQAIAFAKLDSERANVVFLYYLIQIGKEHYRRLQRGVRQKNMNLSMIKAMPVLHPPLALQNQFAEIIQTIEAQKQRQQQVLAQSEALFQSLLQRAFRGELFAEEKTDQQMKMF